jgi:hypothetical protein
MKKKLSPYFEELLERIKATITDARHEDTTGMSVDNLRAIVRTDGLFNLTAAPKGTNAAFYYAMDFREAVAGLPKGYRSFILN